MNAELLYLNSSAILKLVTVETESVALRSRLHPRVTLVSSALARTEVHRAALRRDLAAVRVASQVLAAIDLVQIDDAILRRAGALLPPPQLRSLDAIHLATAELLRGELAGLVTYDDWVAEAAVGMGITVVAPA